MVAQIIRSMHFISALRLVDKVLLFVLINGVAINELIKMRVVILEAI